MSTLAELEEENEKAAAQVSLEEKKALIAEARRRHGGDWKKFLSDAGGGFRSGIDWQAVRFKLQ